MKNIDKVNPFKVEVQNTDFGKITTLIAAKGVSAHGSISFGEKSLLANYVYNKGEIYDLVYTIVDADGNAESYKEDDGTLPKLFLSPAQENFVSVVPYHPDKELEVSIPIFDRENTEHPKCTKPFLGDFVGVSNQYSIFYDVDIWSDTKPDKLLAIEFNDGSITKKHNVKVPLPRDNKVFIENNQVHLLANEGSSWLHRQIDELGNVIKQRRLETKDDYFTEIFSLSFDKTSYVLVEDEGVIIIEKITPEGQRNRVKLIDINDPFYNTWRPVKIDNDTFVVQFNGEFGNGWLTVRNDQLLEIFYSKGTKGFKNLLTNEILSMERDDLVISSINRTKSNSYAIVFYPMTEDEAKNKELIVLNREMK